MESKKIASKAEERSDIMGNVGHTLFCHIEQKKFLLDRTEAISKCKQKVSIVFSTLDNPSF